MSYLPSLATLAGIWILAVMSPGPDFLATVHYATTRSRRDGILVAFGITCALSIWIVGSMVGLGFLMAKVHWLVDIIKTLGALYLIYLGVRTLMSAHQPAADPATDLATDLATDPVTHEAVTRSTAMWRVGFLTNIGNPKALAFFSSLFVVIVPEHPTFGFEVTSVLLMLVIAFGWFTMVACVFSMGPVVKGYLRAKRWLDYLTGALFIVLGVRLALEKL